MQLLAELDHFNVNFLVAAPSSMQQGLKKASVEIAMATTLISASQMEDFFW